MTVGDSRPRFLISAGTPLQTLNALSAVSTVRASALERQLEPRGSAITFYFWPKRDNDVKNDQSRRLIQDHGVDKLVEIERARDSALTVLGRRISLSKIAPVVAAFFSGVAHGRAITIMRQGQQPDIVIGFDQYLHVAHMAWPSAKKWRVDGGFSTLELDFSTHLNQRIERTLLRRIAWRAGVHVQGPRSILAPTLPKTTVIFSIYPFERLALGGMRYRHNSNSALAELYRGLPHGDSSIVVSLNARGRFVHGEKIAPVYKRYLDYCTANGGNKIIYFPRANEPQHAIDVIQKEFGLRVADPVLPVEMWIPLIFAKIPECVFTGWSTAGDVLGSLVNVDRYQPYRRR